MNICLMTTKQPLEILHSALRTKERWRVSGYRPSCNKVEGRLLCVKSNLVDWLSRCHQISIAVNLNLEQ